MQNMVEFWSDLWSKPKSFNVDSKWIKNEESRCEDVRRCEITPQEIHDAASSTQNWKAPGPDKVNNIWVKKFSSFHVPISVVFNQIINDPEKMPVSLLTGNTFLLPKVSEPTHPADFRPITCLSVIYKLFTKVISNRIYQHCDDNSIMTDMQKGCKKFSQGCKDQLTIDSVVVKQALKKHRNLSMAYIDYKKAFDSMPHEYLIHVLKIYKINGKLIEFLQCVMKKWTVKLCIGSEESDVIHIRSGIYQGDALSPLWFCLGMNILSSQLQAIEKQVGFKIKNDSRNTYINHLLYVDDIKLYASDKDKLHRMVRMVHGFSTEIGMEFGLEKCKIVNIKRGKVEDDDGGCEIDTEKIIENLGDAENYKYLGLLQLRGFCKKHIKEKISSCFK